jgi:hypothetical protein
MKIVRLARHLWLAFQRQFIEDEFEIILLPVVKLSQDREQEATSLVVVRGEADDGERQT